MVEPSTCPYTSPIVVIMSKKDGKCQFYVDYRRLNAITEEAASSMPTIPDTLCDLGQAKVFSTIELRSVYWQIPLTERVMPFGFKNAPANFQRGTSTEAGAFDELKKKLEQTEPLYRPRLDLPFVLQTDMVAVLYQEHEGREFEVLRL